MAMQQRRRRKSREKTEEQPPQEQRTPLVIGEADRRLDALIEQEKRSQRAASLPAPSGLRRVAIQGDQGASSSQAAGTGMALHPGQGEGQEAAAGQVLTDPRAAQLGLGQLQQAVRSSFELLQNALHRHGGSGGQGLLAPLLQGSDQGQGQPGLLSNFGTPGMQSGGSHGHHGVHGGSGHAAGLQPRVLDPYGPTGIATPTPDRNVNPFWSEHLQQAARQENAVHGHLGPTQQQPVSPGPDEVEKLREKIMKEAQELFEREVKRLTDGGDATSSYVSAASAGADVKREASAMSVEKGPKVLGAKPTLGADASGSRSMGLDLPPGLPGGRLPGGMVAAPTVVPEAVRSLELPSLPHPATDGAALLFGDWLIVAYPLMSDLSSTSQLWWDGCLEAAQQLYEQWLVATPLERLRLKPKEVTVDPLHQRVEQRGVSLLLSVLPDQLRRDVISARNVTTVSILFRLFVVYQPGGSAERTTLLKSLTEVKVGHTIPDLLATMRQWRRQLQRAEELKVTLPDPLILMNVLGKLMDSMSKLGGSQVAYRISTVRQELLVDQRPGMSSIKDLSEYLQAELEDLALVIAVPKSASGAVPAVNATQPVATIKALQSGSSEEKSKATCRYWGTTAGCRKGEQCTFLHSWENVPKENRCFVCSGESHFAKDCPTKKDRSLRDVKKVSKVKGAQSSSEATSKPSEEVSRSKVNEEVTGPTATSSSTPLKKSKASGSENVEKVAAPSTDAATALIAEATSLLKSLRSMKACRVKQVVLAGMNLDDPVALLDGGATNLPRMVEPHERDDLSPVQVELAHGSTTLYKKPHCSTLLSLDPVEPIIPLNLLVQHGFKIQWSRQGCVIQHPRHGPIRCWLRAGCPVMNRSSALKMLQEFEQLEMGQQGPSEEELAWWRSRFPGIPEDFAKAMEGTLETPSGAEVPWNRRHPHEF